MDGREHETTFRGWRSRGACLAGLAIVMMAAPALSAEGLPEARPVPDLQVIPLPGHEASLQRQGHEFCRYHFGDALRRTFLFPLVGPSGRSVTRMGHPHDPNGHSHHNSVWIAHHDVQGVDFWGDSGKGRITHRRVIDFQDGMEAAAIVVENAWRGDQGQILLVEERQMRFLPKPEGEWFLDLRLKLSTPKDPVTLGKTPFGLIGVRMAKTVGVHDGGGLIRNSEGGRNEVGVFWKPARWVDYSGPITSTAIEGITLFDHPSNLGHPCHFHVRDDGWMGASLTHERAITIEVDKPLLVHYGLYIHANLLPSSRLEDLFAEFSRTPAP